MYVTFGQKPAYTEKVVVKRRPRVKQIKGSVNGWTYYKMQPRNREKQRASQEYQSHYTDKNPQRQMTRNSPAESPILLRREIPMAWGTTIDSLTPEINHFQYAIEIKCLTLKDQTSYLIPDGWSRSPLSFPIFSLNWYNTSSTTSKQYKHTIYHGVRSILAYIINNVKAFDIFPWTKYSFKYTSLDRKRYFY